MNAVHTASDIDKLIQDAADHHVGHPEEIDEELIITAQRESFKWGTIWMAKYVEKVYNIKILD